MEATTLFKPQGFEVSCEFTERIHASSQAKRGLVRLCLRIGCKALLVDLLVLRGSGGMNIGTNIGTYMRVS